MSEQSQDQQPAPQAPPPSERPPKPVLPTTWGLEVVERGENGPRETKVVKPPQER